MAYGTTNVDIIQSSTAGTPVVFKDGNGTQIGTLCRAWVNWTGGSTPAVQASFNVSSITRTGTGLFTVSFTNAMPDVKYSVSAAGCVTTGSLNGTLSLYGATVSTNPLSIGSFTIKTTGNGSLGTGEDPNFAGLSVFR